MVRDLRGEDSWPAVGAVWENHVLFLWAPSRNDPHYPQHSSRVSARRREKLFALIIFQLRLL